MGFLYNKIAIKIQTKNPQKYPAKLIKTSETAKNLPGVMNCKNSENSATNKPKPQLIKLNNFLLNLLVFFKYINIDAQEAKPLQPNNAK